MQVIRGDIFGAWKETRQRLPMKEVKLLAPLAPVNVLCLGRNYKAHADESGADIPKQPLLFIKATSSVIAPAEPIVIPFVLVDALGAAWTSWALRKDRITEREKE